MFKVWLGFVVGLLVVASNAGAADSGRRFSQAISPEDREAIGLARLSSDELAILDALVRRDLANQLFAERDSDAPTTFSDRLTADERKNTGVAKMSPAERDHLNATLARIQSSSMTQTLLTPPVFMPRNALVLPQSEKKKAKKGLETHGSLTLSYGWGDGFSTRSGSMVVNMTDPEKKYSITIGYGETHVKGANAPAVLMSGPPYYGDGMYLRP